MQGLADLIRQLESIQARSTAIAESLVKGITPDALAQMNRYSVTQIVISASGLETQRISGVLRVGDVETEALALQRYFNLHEISHSNREIVLRR